MEDSFLSIIPLSILAKEHNLLFAADQVVDLSLLTQYPELIQVLYFVQLKDFEALSNSDVPLLGTIVIGFHTEKRVQWKF